MKRQIFILLCSLCVFSTEAQNVIRPKIAGPNGLFVNSYNGVLFFGQTDIETQNTAMPMQLRFYYNSSANETNYGYGLGFSLGYEMRYEVDDQGNVTIETGDGRTDVYKKYGDDYEAPAGVFSRLTYTDGKYVLSEKTGERYEFADASHKKMTAQEDRHGNRTTLTYSTDSLLTRIQDAVGHTITLEYSNKLLSRATASFLNGSISYGYDSKKRLVKRTDAMGFTTAYDYDKENHLDEITDANGNKTLITYNASGMVSRMKTAVSDKSIRYDGDKTVFIDYTKPKNIYSYYRWDDKGRVIEKVGMCCGVQSKMEYDEDDNVIRRTDANGNISLYTYDEWGNVLSVTDAKGNTEHYTYDVVFNKITTFQDKNGNEYRFEYNNKGDLTAILGPEGVNKSYTYDEHGWMLTDTDANGNVKKTSYNADGTIAQVMDAAGFLHRFNYDLSGNIVKEIDSKNQQTFSVYDANNRLVSKQNALGNTTSLSYDKVGNLVRIKDPKNHITAFSYDAEGHILTQVDALGGVSKFTYDGLGNMLTFINPLGQVMTMTYNENNKLISQTNAADETTSFDYDAKGNLTTIFKPNGNVVNYVYDSTDLLKEISDNIGLIAIYTYDNNGNLLKITDGLNRTMAFEYDNLNRTTAVILPMGNKTSYTYDNNSNLISVSDALGHIVKYSYSSLNQLISQTDALNAVTNYEYDGNGNLIRVTDAKGNATVYSYDAVNNNTTVTLANGLSYQNTFDEVGNIIQTKDLANNTFNYAYDQLGKIICKTYPDNTKDLFSYDAGGQMIAAVNKDATVAFTYDAAGRVKTEMMNGKTTKYDYDIAGGQRSFVYPSGMKVVEKLNARDMITNIQQDGKDVISVNYDKAGQKTSQMYANGLTTDYEYNANGWLTNIKDDKSITNFVMTYDPVGNMIKRQDLINTEQTETFGYDAINQLVSYNRGTSINNSYQYDLVGNRIKTTENGVTTNYVSSNVNTFISITGGLSFTPIYDDNGNMLNDDKHNFVYDWNNRLSKVDNGNVSYKYDALGRRIANDKLSYFYLGNQMVEEYVDGNLSSSFLYGNGENEILQMKKENTDFYYHANNIGSISALTDTEGCVVERMFYESYGTPTINDKNGNSLDQSNVGNPFMFMGRPYNYETSGYLYEESIMCPDLGYFYQRRECHGLTNCFSFMNNSPQSVYSPTAFSDNSGSLLNSGDRYNANFDSNSFDTFADYFVKPWGDYLGYASTIVDWFDHTKYTKNFISYYKKEKANYKFELKKDFVRLWNGKVSFVPNLKPGNGFKAFRNANREVKTFAGRIGNGLTYFGLGIDAFNIARNIYQGTISPSDFISPGVSILALKIPIVAKAALVKGSFDLGWFIGEKIRDPFWNQTNIGKCLAPIVEGFFYEMIETFKLSKSAPFPTTFKYL